jgi:hypothetical protein
MAFDQKTQETLPRPDVKSKPQKAIPGIIWLKRPSAIFVKEKRRRGEPFKPSWARGLRPPPQSGTPKGILVYPPKWPYSGEKSLRGATCQKSVFR